MSRIALRVPRVRCVDETGGKFAEKFGNDEMYLGAVYVLINANKSFTVTTTGAKLVGNNFDDGETVNWNRDLFNFDLGDHGVLPYPKAVVAALVLAEHDAGNGRNAFLEKMAAEFGVKLRAANLDDIINRSTARVASGGGAAVAPAAVPVFVVEALKEFAKETIKEIGKKLISTASAWVGDDIFEPQQKSLDIPSANHTWNGQRQTPEEVVRFVGHKGIYDVSMFWRLE